MYNSYLKSGRGSLLGCLHGKHLHLVIIFNMDIIILVKVSIGQYVYRYYVLSYTVVRVVIFEYKCMHVVLEYKCIYLQKNKNIFGAMLKTVHFHWCMHVYARGYGTTLF